MRAIIIVGASLRLTPYAFQYINELLRQGYEVTAFVWNRDGKEDIFPDERARIICFCSLLDDAAPKRRKLIKFLKFRNAVGKELKELSYDFVVVLDTQFAVLFSDILIKRYKGKFIYDMRDPSYERYSLYRKRVAHIVDAAAAVFISSEAYRKYLPKSEKIYVTHNIRKEDIGHSGIRAQSEREHSPLRISFWGCIRDVQINYKLIDAIKNDRRFVINYYGVMNEESKPLVQYCEDSGIGNVYFYGKYMPDDRYSFAENTEIIHNIYSNGYDGTNPCVGNKFYDGVIFKIPQICLASGYMGELVSSQAIGLAISIDDNLADKLWEYYHSIDWKEFEASCENVLSMVLAEYNNAVTALSKTISGVEAT